MKPDPKPLEPLRTLADFAAHLGCHPKTARRFLLDAMMADPGLRVTRVGRSLLFTPEQFARTLEALAWRSPGADVAISRERQGPTISIVRRSGPESAVREEIRELTQRPRPSKGRKA